MRGSPPLLPLTPPTLLVVSVPMKSQHSHVMLKPVPQLLLMDSFCHTRLTGHRCYCAADSREGGIVGRVHLLKDTASGAKQHPLRTYMGTSSTAEGDATEQLVAFLKVRTIKHRSCALSNMTLVFTMSCTLPGEASQACICGG